MIHENHSLTVQEVVEEVSISTESCHTTDKLHMHRISAKSMACLFTDDQKENGVNISQELLDWANNINENFLKNIVTEDKNCVYGYDVKTNA